MLPRKFNMFLILFQAIALYLISQYLHRYLSFSRTMYVVLMFPGTIAHETSHTIAALLMGARITKFSVIPSGNILGYVEHTDPKIPVIGNVAISIAPLMGCPALLLFVSSYFGMFFDYPSASSDIYAGTRSLIEGTFSFIAGLDYLNWKTYVFLYLALTLGAGAAPSKTDITGMLPGLIVFFAVIYGLDYYNFDIRYLYNVFSLLSAALSIAMIPLLAVTFFIGMLQLSLAAIRTT